MLDLLAFIFVFFMSNFAFYISKVFFIKRKITQRLFSKITFFPEIKPFLMYAFSFFPYTIYLRKIYKRNFIAIFIFLCYNIK